MQSKSKSQLPASVPLVQHLYQMYPQMPKYAADPSESRIIETYDHIMNRFQGQYGKQPQFFVKSPAYLNLLGDTHPYVGEFSKIGICSFQEIIIAVRKNPNSDKIRVKNYQSVVFGEQSFGTKPIDWKFQKGSFGSNYPDSESESKKELQSSNKTVQEYNHIIVSTLKNSLGNEKNYSPTGLDLLVFCDFLPEEHIEWRISFIYALHAAFQCVIFGQKALGNDSFKNVLKKVQNIFNDWRQSRSMLYSEFGKILLEKSDETTDNEEEIKFNSTSKDPYLSSLQHFQFPENLSIVIADSMTPLPKKLILGKRDNLRQCEVLIGIEIIKAELGIIATINSLKQLQSNMSCSLQQLLDSIQEVLPKEKVSAQQIQQLTEKTLIQILKEVPYANNVIDQNLSFQPYKRMVFFVKEELLIREMMKEMEKNGNQNKTSSNEQKSALSPSEILINTLSSSAKNAKKYLNEPSEQIIDMASKVEGLYKTYKILGNGWGGNILFFCERNNADKIVQVLNKEFYLSQDNKILLGDELEIYTKVIIRPNSGVMVLNPESQIWY